MNEWPILWSRIGDVYVFRFPRCPSALGMFHRHDDMDIGADFLVSPFVDVFTGCTLHVCMNDDGTADVLAGTALDHYPHEPEAIEKHPDDLPF